MKSKVHISNNSLEDVLVELRKSHNRFKVTANVHGDITIVFPEELTEQQVETVRNVLKDKMSHMKVTKHEKVK